MNKKKDNKGITSQKEDFSEWFTQMIIKADLADYSEVSGCIILKPTAYALWENITKEINKRFEKIGLKNVYFPLFIPEKNLAKEKEHMKGFSPEVAWVTEAGNSKLNERLAIRPTSETIMYPSFSKWIRSWRDLPLRFNQWCNVVRWEFKHAIPFLRTREFLWQEGHTVFSTKEEAEKEGKTIIKIYNDVCRNYMALPAFIGKKSDKEKFAGAIYTISIEYYMPNGKAIQGPDFHFDGQNFSKAYNIKFLNKKGKEEYVWQNTFGFTTRMLGVMFSMHSDNKGLIIPPKIAQNKVVIIPIFNEENKEKIIKEAKKIKEELEKINPILDDREEYRPGFKFNEYELKGIPLRIEIGNKEIKKKEVVLIRRDTNKKKKIRIKDIKKEVNNILEEIQINLLEKSEKNLKKAITNATNLEDLKKGIEEKKIMLAPLCKKIECEEELKEKTKGAKVLNIPFEQPQKKGKCIICKKNADYIARIGKSY